MAQGEIVNVSKWEYLLTFLALHFHFYIITFILIFQRCNHNIIIPTHIYG